jgi:pyruvate formate lyase activating enzyme
MSEITRRQFLKALTSLGLAACSGGTLLSQLSCSSRRERAGTLQAVPPPPPFSREARHYQTLEGDLSCQSCHGAIQPSRVLYCHNPHEGSYVKCQLCPKGCIISEGHRGDCRVRENRDGKLYTMVYGNPCAVHADPIEKKPFYHFLPTSVAFSIATAGCNLHCQYCQNWEISQFPPEELDTYDLPPEGVVDAALRSGSDSVAYTYSEPTIFYEYMVDTARMVREAGLRNVVISAGYINPGPLRELCRTVDAIKIDLKGFNEDFYQRVCDATLQPVLDTIRLINEEGVYLEIVNLVVPTLNDHPDELRELARWIVDSVGPDVPIHFSRFQPKYKLMNLPPTPVESLETAREIAMEEGINYAYVGNVPGHPANHTYCARCGQPIIIRQGFAVLDYHLGEGNCAYCGNPIPGVWRQAGGHHES